MCTLMMNVYLFCYYFDLNVWKFGVDLGIFYKHLLLLVSNGNIDKANFNATFNLRTLTFVAQQLYR